MARGVLTEDDDSHLLTEKFPADGKVDIIIRVTVCNWIQFRLWVKVRVVGMSTVRPHYC